MLGKTAAWIWLEVTDFNGLVLTLWLRPAWLFDFFFPAAPLPAMAGLTVSSLFSLMARNALRAWQDLLDCGKEYETTDVARLWNFREGGNLFVRESRTNGDSEEVTTVAWTAEICGWYEIGTV
jgi:hypothetical protein